MNTANTLALEALKFLMATKWKSIDKDNMEFAGRVTCFQLDKAREAIAAIEAEAVQEPASWHRDFVDKVRELTSSTHDQAFTVLGIVIDLREDSQQKGFSRGFDAAIAQPVQPAPTESVSN